MIIILIRFRPSRPYSKPKEIKGLKRVLSLFLKKN